MASQKVVKNANYRFHLIENRPIKIKVTTTNLASSIVEGRFLRDPASFLPGSRFVFSGIPLRFYRDSRLVHDI